MTPGEHIAEAERLITDSSRGVPDYFIQDNLPELLAAAAHALIAVAVELGAPHAPAAPGGEQGAQQA